MSVQVSAKSYWIGYQTILIKEITRILRIWAQTLIPPVITMSLYFVIFGAIIGRRVGEMNGLPYMDFIVPGLIMLSVITNSYGNITSSFFGAKFGRHVEELLVSPLPPWIILAGYVSGAVFRALAVGILVWLIAGVFSGFHMHNVAVTFSILILTAVVFALGGFINAIYAQKFDDISIIPTFVLQPLTYLGGVFFSVSLLPGFWQNLSLVNPIVYMVSAFRFGLLGISDIPLWQAYAIVCGFAVVLFVICMTLLKRGVGLRS
ncbi:ABC transporter permease [Wenzhouxiangella marina]|uniref:Transport permease protein n=1 Tax=Wenzhouxiangella marina TaxID=1579979 RepID=A0A0K0Y065_9GAMM|nr:ABC transporter permease [Wenzhouxiangella marina]AKS43329.1 membrane protein [Wenzhouxiangella marina]MBB6088556.1 ABC-2 type transport system permease protein [Wenzhouxiangella marina]